jgi:hypothetical protein
VGGHGQLCGGIAGVVAVCVDGKDLCLVPRARFGTQSVGAILARPSIDNEMTKHPFYTHVTGTDVANFDDWMALSVETKHRLYFEMSTRSVISQVLLLFETYCSGN